MEDQGEEEVPRRKLKVVGMTGIDAGLRALLLREAGEVEIVPMDNLDELLPSQDFKEKIELPYIHMQYPGDMPSGQDRRRARRKQQRKTKNRK